MSGRVSSANAVACQQEGTPRTIGNTVLLTSRHSTERSGSAPIHQQHLYDGPTCRMDCGSSMQASRHPLTVVSGLGYTSGSTSLPAVKRAGRQAVCYWAIPVCHTTMSYQCVIQPCHTSVSHNHVMPVCHTTVSYQCVTQPCHASVSHNHVIEWPTLYLTQTATVASGRICQFSAGALSGRSCGQATPHHAIPCYGTHKMERHCPAPHLTRTQTG
jgi:hypothetical protein